MVGKIYVSRKLQSKSLFVDGELDLNINSYLPKASKEFFTTSTICFQKLGLSKSYCLIF